MKYRSEKPEGPNPALLWIAGSAFLGFVVGVVILVVVNK